MIAEEGQEAESREALAEDADVEEKRSSQDQLPTPTTVVVPPSPELSATEPDA